ncbi:MAG TPA: Mpo1-like protein [Methylocystis sp.]|nr:Mpo1-like protein [Methylocystis sp.]
MQSFLQALKVQRWDDHRYYHQNRINQTLHLVSAFSFLYCYALLLKDPALAAIIAWLVSMLTRQAGHFFFEPRDYDDLNHATQEYKESIKVGYNLQRKRALMAIWALSPLPLLVDPTLFGLFGAPANAGDLLRHVGYIWFFVGAAGFLFRIGQLFVQQDVMTGVVWAAKILTDPFHDIQIYLKSPLYLFRKAESPHAGTGYEDCQEPDSDDEAEPAH